MRSSRKRNQTLIHGQDGPFTPRHGGPLILDHGSPYILSLSKDANTTSRSFNGPAITGSGSYFAISVPRKLIASRFRWFSGFPLVISAKVADPRPSRDRRPSAQSGREPKPPFSCWTHHLFQNPAIHILLLDTLIEH